MEDVTFSDPSLLSNPTNYRLTGNEFRGFFFLLKKLNLDDCEIRPYFSIHPTKGDFPGLSIVQKDPHREILRIAFEGFPGWELFSWMKDTLDGEEFSLNVVLHKIRNA